jgi:hypothetical protein
VRHFSYPAGPIIELSAPAPARPFEVCPGRPAVLLLAPEVQGRVIASACIATLTTALLVWAEHHGGQHLPDLVDDGFMVLRNELG